MRAEQPRMAYMMMQCFHQMTRGAVAVSNECADALLVLYCQYIRDEKWSSRSGPQEVV